MATPIKANIEEALRKMAAIDEAVREGAREAVQMHQRLGHSVAVWRDGKAVDVPANEVVLPQSEPAEKQDERHVRRKAV
jgi:hypothetical protein